MPYLSSRAVERALRRLDRLAASEHVVLELALCHGAVIATPYAKPSGGHLQDGTVLSGGLADAMIRQVGAELRLPPNWLKEDVKFYLALFAARGRSDSDMIGPNVVLSVSDSSHVIAMKLWACDSAHPPHQTDLADLEFLIRAMYLDCWADVESIYARFMPGHALSDDTRTYVREMFAVAK